VAIPPEDQLYTAVLQKRYGNSQYTAGKNLSPEAEFSAEIQTKVLKVFLLVIVTFTTLLSNFYFFKLTQPRFCQGERKKT
jgi:hypothetical protein